MLKMKEEKISSTLVEEDLDVIDHLDVPYILPEQFFSKRGLYDTYVKEKLLAFKVFENALTSVRNGIKLGLHRHIGKEFDSKMGIKESALNSFVDDYLWVMSVDNNHLYSFESLCTLFDIDPGNLRKTIINYSKEY